ncbi:phage protein NinX family protein [Morganella morganii]|uniref:phage protein NinX family protein n=1 Tax=Morganella morganii TaxID=582 RepID=UPI0034E5D3D9
MNKYRDKSDFEINKAVAVNINGADAVVEKFGILYINDEDRSAMVSFAPCNNPYDAMPIIIENKISLYAPRLNEDWMAEYAGGTEGVNDGFQVDYFDAHNQNPLRAAMEVFLMMKDAENETNT